MKDTEAGTLGLREQPSREGEPRSCRACQALLQSRLPQPWTPNESRASRGLGRLRVSSTGRPGARRLPPRGWARPRGSHRCGAHGLGGQRDPPLPPQHRKGEREGAECFLVWQGRGGPVRAGEGRAGAYGDLNFSASSAPGTRRPQSAPGGVPEDGRSRRSQHPEGHSGQSRRRKPREADGRGAAGGRFPSTQEGRNGASAGQGGAEGVRGPGDTGTRSRGSSGARCGSRGCDAGRGGPEADRGHSDVRSRSLPPLLLRSVPTRSGNPRRRTRALRAPRGVTSSSG